jgi:hypothetical protein
MFDSEARLLYVGKAKNLKKRLPAISARPAWRRRPLRWWRVSLRSKRPLPPMKPRRC